MVAQADLRTWEEIQVLLVQISNVLLLPYKQMIFNKLSALIDPYVRIVIWATILKKYQGGRRLDIYYSVCSFHLNIESLNAASTKKHREWSTALDLHLVTPVNRLKAERRYIVE